MANILIEQASIENIANAIREKNGTDNKYKPSEMSQAIRDIKSDSWYDVFWDVFQINGERDNYNCAFYDYCTPNCWDSSVLYPKYNIYGVNFSGCFRDVKGELDLVARLKEQNITLDTSKATAVGSMFRSSELIAIPTINLQSCDITLTGTSAGAYHMFSGCSKLHTIEKIISKEGITYTNTFQNCTALKNITFDGVINQSISFQNSPLLTVDSVNSIIDALFDYSKTTTTPTLTLNYNVKTNLSDTQISAITSKNWNLA